jgi:hypothetical protein
MKERNMVGEVPGVNKNMAAEDKRNSNICIKYYFSTQG